MSLKRNPLKLNALQLKTLTIIQALAKSDRPSDEDHPIPALPSAHDDHFHVGSHLVMRTDATGLHNAAAWTALNRKGLVSGQPPKRALLTVAGAAYETGMADKILHPLDH